MVALATAFIKLRPDPDRAAFTRAGKEMGEEAGRAAGGGFGAGYTRGSTGAAREAHGTIVKEAGKAGDKAGSGFGAGFKKGNSKSLGDGSSLFKGLAVAGKFTLLGSAAAGAVPGVLQLTAALVPAAGAMLALPAAIGGLLAAKATFKVAMSGVEDAIKTGFTGTAKQAAKSMKELPPAAREFAGAIIDLKPKVEALRKAVAQRFFAPLQDDIRPLVNQYFPMLSQQMAGLGGSLGGLGGRLAQAARQADVFNGVRDLFTATRLAVNNLRGAVTPLVTAFGVLIQSTAPELPRLAQGFTGLAQKVGQYVTGAVDSGRVNAVFEQGIATLKDLGGIVGNVGSIIKSVFAAATAGGNTLLSNLRSLTGEAAGFLKTAQGVGALQAVFGTLGQLSAGLRTSLGAVLPAIGQALQAIGPAIGGLAGPFSQLVVAVAPLLPAFAGIAALVISQLTPAISGLAGFLAQHTSLVKAAAIAVGTFLAVQKATAAVMAVQAAGGLIAYIRQMSIVTNLTKIWTALQIVFNAVMSANPIALVVLAIGALVAAIVIAYKHSETFRNIVNAAWGGIKTAVGAVVGWFTSTVWPALKAVWSGIAAGALWLWHNVLEPAWNGIKAVVGVVVTIVKAYIAALMAEFRIIAGVAMWLWHNIFQPVFNGIGWVVHAAWVVIQIALKAFQLFLTNVIFPVVRFLYNSVIKPVFDLAGKTISFWWNGYAKPVFAAAKAGFQALGTAFKWVWDTLVKPLFNSFQAAISGWWNNHLKPAFASVRGAFQALGTALRGVWDNTVKPMFERFSGFLRNTVAPAFSKGVEAIRGAWERVKEAARAPVAFVVNKVINPFIGGINRAASVVGVKDRISPITGFRDGGQFLVGHASGGKISGAGGISDNRQAMIPGVGAVQLQGGEYIVNRQDTAKALPILKWINAGMRGGSQKIASYIGRPLANEPGDGSEGWAFKDGGIVGWAKDVWGAITNPGETIKRPFEALLSRIPGAGMIKDFLVGSAKKVLTGAVGWLTGLGNGDGGGNVAKAMAFVRAQAGKPYVWASAGPGGYDCSGIVSAAYRVMQGKNPYSHIFSTESLPGSWFTRNKVGPLMAGWSHPGQRPASASVGHMAGQIGALPFESTGSAGVRIGGAARRITDFANKGAARFLHGGLFEHPVRLFDQGGYWPSGTLGANLSGRTEFVQPNGAAGRGGNTYQITVNVAPTSHPAEVGRATVQAIQAFERGNGSSWRK